MSTNGSTPSTSSTPGTPAPPGSPEAIEADIARQREQLAGTVNQLQAKLDVKARAKDKASELRSRATTSDGKPTPQVIGGAAVAMLVVVGLVLLRRRNR